MQEEVEEEEEEGLSRGDEEEEELEVVEVEVKRGGKRKVCCGSRETTYSSLNSKEEVLLDTRCSVFKARTIPIGCWFLWASMGALFRLVGLLPNEAS
ncbi:hypothetical protein M0802_002090 [Mischocyttarus mexicanus]|nr:hypothetical protein M0802_002090 [Mischocyttarus mexicanus]